MTKEELIAEHAECDRQVSGVLRALYKLLHLRRIGCPACSKLKRAK